MLFIKKQKTKISVDEALIVVKKRYPDLKIIGCTETTNWYDFDLRTMTGEVPMISGSPAVNKYTGKYRFFHWSEDDELESEEVLNNYTF